MANQITVSNMLIKLKKDKIDRMTKMSNGVGSNQAHTRRIQRIDVITDLLKRVDDTLLINDSYSSAVGKVGECVIKWLNGQEFKLSPKNKHDMTIGDINYEIKIFGADNGNPNLTPIDNYENYLITMVDMMYIFYIDKKFYQISGKTLRPLIANTNNLKKEKSKYRIKINKEIKSFIKDNSIELSF